MPAPLFLRSDDAGLSPGTNQAIDDVAHVVPNIGLMPPTPAIEEAIERFRGRRDLCLGLHFTLNSEWSNLRWKPLSPPEKVPGLVLPDGTLRPSPWVLPPGFAYDVREVETEMRAQLEFLRDRNVDVRYLDAHMVVFATKPELGELAQRFAQREGLAYHDHRPKLNHGPYSADVAENLARWTKLLDVAPAEPTVAFFHPASADGVVEALSEGGKPSPLPTRAAEHALLKDARFASLLREKGHAFARFDGRASG